MKRNFTEEQVGTFRAVQKLIRDIDAITSDIISGTSVATACRKQGIGYMRYRRIVTTLQNQSESQGVIPPETKINFNDPKYFTFAERIYSKVFELKSYSEVSRFVPLDADETVERVIEEALTPRQREIIMLRYEQNLPAAEVGERFGITRQCVNEYEHGAIMRLRHPKNARRLEKGFAIAKQIEDAEQRAKEDVACKVAKEAYREAYMQAMIDAQKAKHDEWETARTGISAETRNTPLNKLDLSVRARNCLSNAGIRTLGDIMKLSEDKLSSIWSMGKKSVAEVMDLVSSYGYQIEPSEQEDCMINAV